MTGSEFNPMMALKEFHDAAGVVRWINQPDEHGRRKLAKLRLRLIQEEFKEVCDELLDVINGNGNMANLAKEIADLHYVLYGTEEALHIPGHHTFNEVHRSNMTKVNPTSGKIERRGDGKILKPESYEEADIQGVLFDLD